MKLSTLFRDRRQTNASAAGGDFNPSSVGFCPPKRDRSKSLCVPQAMPLIRVETCKEDGLPAGLLSSVSGGSGRNSPSGSGSGGFVSGNNSHLIHLDMFRKTRRTSMAT